MPLSKPRREALVWSFPIRARQSVRNSPSPVLCEVSGCQAFMLCVISCLGTALFTANLQPAQARETVHPAVRTTATAESMSPLLTRSVSCRHCGRHDGGHCDIRPRHHGAACGGHGATGGGCAAGAATGAHGFHHSWGGYGPAVGFGHFRYPYYSYRAPWSGCPQRQHKHRLVNETPLARGRDAVKDSSPEKPLYSLSPAVSVDFRRFENSPGPIQFVKTAKPIQPIQPIQRNGDVSSGVACRTCGPAKSSLWTLMSETFSAHQRGLRAKRLDVRGASKMR